MQNMNGHLIGAGKVKWEMSHVNDMRRHVLGLVQNMGGNMPIADPATFLTLGLVLDKLDAIDKRLTAIEEAQPKFVNGDLTATAQT